jgi:hypothetical protein
VAVVAVVICAFSFHFSSFIDKCISGTVPPTHEQSAGGQFGGVLPQLLAHHSSLTVFATAMHDAFAASTARTVGGVDTGVLS